MAITTYAQLQTAIASWLARSDLTATIPDFITLFESAANRRLRVRQMEAVASLTPSSGAAALPTDYLAWRRLTWTGANRVELAYVAPSYLQAAYPSASADTPRIFTIEGATLRIRPVDDTALELLYYQKIPALADGSPTNWLIATHPDLYLFGALAEAQMFAVDPEKAALWKGRRDELIEEISALSNKTRGAGVIRVMGTVV
jgi:hypothetical protein